MRGAVRNSSLLKGLSSAFASTISLPKGLQLMSNILFFVPEWRWMVGCGAVLLAATAVGFAGQPPDSYVRSWPPCMPWALAWAQTWSPRGIKQRARLAVQPLDPALRTKVPAVDSTMRQCRGCTLAERVLQRTWCQLQLPCGRDAGADEDLLRVDVAFAEGITQKKWNIV